MTEVLFVYPANTPEYLRAIRADRKLSIKARMLCAILSTHGLRNAWSKELAGEMGVHPDTVTAAKKEAVAAGWLEYVRHGGQGNALHDEFNLTIPLPDSVNEPVKRSEETGPVSSRPIRTVPNDRSEQFRMTDPNSSDPEEIEPEIEMMTTTSSNSNVQGNAPGGAELGVEKTVDELLARLAEELRTATARRAPTYRGEYSPGQRRILGEIAALNPSAQQLSAVGCQLPGKPE